MKPAIVRVLFLLGFAALTARAQEVIPLYPGVAPGSVEENYSEKEYFSKVWNTEVVSNVTKPSLTVFKPAAGTATGEAAVICPGGGFMALSITSEGTDVAKWLTARGETAFVLKYRLAHSGEDATQEFTTLFADRQKFEEMIGKTVPLSIADGIAAVVYVKKHASEWGIKPERVGIIGFSAGGTVTAAVGLRYSPEGRPAFVAPIYAAASMLKNLPYPPTHRPCSWQRPAMTNSGLRWTVSDCTISGKTRTSRSSCICMRRADMASACGNRGCLPMNGSTALAIGFNRRGG